MNVKTISIVLVLLAVGAWFWTRYNQGGLPVETVAVKKSSVKEFVDERAQTRLPKTYLITTPFEGRVLAVDWAEGAKVEANQTVAQISPPDLATQVAQATASVERLQASWVENNDHSVEKTTLDQAKKYVTSMAQTVQAAQAQVEAAKAKQAFADKQLQRNRKLFESGNIGEEQINQIELNMVEANVEYQQDQLLLSSLQSIYAATVLVPLLVEQYIDRKDLHGNVLEKEKSESAARLEQVKRNQQRGTMTSPVTGVVLHRRITNEQVLPAGTVLLEIGQLEQLEVEVEVLTQDAVRIATGQTVELYGPALGNQSVAGTVKRIYPAGFTKTSSLGVEQQRVLVIVAFDPQQLPSLLEKQRLGVGYRVRARIFTAEAHDTLTIPRSAVFRAAAGAWQLFTVDDNVAKLKTVELGLINDEFVEVKNGLTLRDSVILAPEATLTDGTRVRPVARPNR